MGLVDPWYITKVEFTKGESKLSMGKLDIYIDFKIGSKFKEVSSPVLYGAYDTVERRWRHANFFQHECYVHAFVPRIKLPDGSVKQVQVPWAMKGSSFTLLFEAMSMLLVQEGMSLSGAGRTVKEDSRVIGRIINIDSSNISPTPYTTSTIPYIGTPSSQKPEPTSSIPLVCISQ
ncbi:MAG: transposase family protein [Saprospiraceae bacterium]|nr:transposase family protein [Saprospiraceae bacterium]